MDACGMLLLQKAFYIPDRYPRRTPRVAIRDCLKARAVT